MLKIVQKPLPEAIFSSSLYLLLFGQCIWLLTVFGKSMPYQLDDAYITYRYVDHFLQYGDFAFNSGGKPVEGFTSQLWFWLLVSTAWLFDIENIAVLGPLFGLFSFFIAGILLFLFIKKHDGIFPAFIATALVLTLPALGFYAFSGMEAMLFSVLVLVLGLSWAGYWNLYVVRYLLIIAAIWCRPEAPWLGVMVLMTMIYNRQCRRYLPDVMVMLLAFIALLAYRYAIFGELLPNTYYAKTPVLAKGVEYLLDAIASFWWFWFLVLLAGLGAFLGARRHRLLFFMGISWLIVPVLEGGDWMPLLRFFLPAMLLLAAAASGMAMKGGRTRFTLLLVLPMIAYGNYSINGFQSLYYRYYQWQIMDAYAQAWLEANHVKNIASVDIGSLFYRKNYWAMDLAGLTDSVIAHLPGQYLARKINTAYLLQNDVQVVLIRMARLPDAEAQVTSAMFDNDTELWLFFDPDFLRYFDLVMMLDYPEHAMAGNFWGYMVLARKDLQLSPKPLPIRHNKGFDFVDYSRPVELKN